MAPNIVGLGIYGICTSIDANKTGGWSDKLNSGKQDYLLETISKIVPGAPL